jgi:hypothetical protein
MRKRTLKEYLNIPEMDLQTQIEIGERELNAYKIGTFADPGILLWFESVLESLKDLQRYRDKSKPLPEKL